MIYFLRASVVPAYLLLCLLLGGASAAGHFANMFLQLIAIGLIGWSLLIRRDTPMPRASRQLLALASVLVLIGLVQLIPLPPSIWTKFPGREEIVSGYQLLGMPLPWQPMSITPYLTVASLLWLLPAFAVVLAMVRASAFSGIWLAFAIGTATVLGIALGAIQRSGNEEAYLYEITNYGVATGFFSNANHMATLLLVATPFAAALYLVGRANSRSAQQSSGLLVLLVGAAGVLVVGVAINGSLAGAGLAVPVLGASALMVLSRKRKIPAWAPLPLVALLLVAVLAVFSKPLGNDLTATATRGDPISRATSFPITIDAALEHLPTGSGIGSFNTIYSMHEEPESLTTTYMNHAHSDLLEIFLETGVLGLGLLALFLLWWARRTFVIWRAEEPDQFARAATIATAAIMAHSLVDYPLRTAAISAIFAMCLALMADARPIVRQRQRQGGDNRRSSPRHLSAD